MTYFQQEILAHNKHLAMPDRDTVN